jgi:dihydroorotase
LRQQRDRDALRDALLDGTIDALVSDHTPVDDDAKTLPFAEAEPGATGLELLLSLALKWSHEMTGPTAKAQGTDPIMRALGVITHRPAGVLAQALAPQGAQPGQLCVGTQADICIFNPSAERVVRAEGLRSQGKHTPFMGYALPGQVQMTLVRGEVTFDNMASEA